MMYRRSIPAWAGETHCVRDNCRIARVYPRVGGGNRQPKTSTKLRHGLSPRGRGKPDAYARPRLSRRSIPAWAGETSRGRAYSSVYTVYPRVGGGNRLLRSHKPFNKGLSPRGRGKRARRWRSRPCLRSIPAWAGETRGSVCCKRLATVYPRVGGGNSIDDMLYSSHNGLSPRGRGKPRQR